MKALDKKTEQEVLKVYQSLYEATIAGEVEKFEPFLHEDIQVIGTTREEVFRSKETYLEALKGVLQQVAGIADYRNRDIKVMGWQGGALVEEHSDVYVNINGEWTFYAKARNTSFFEPGPTGWLLVYQHVSFPDSSVETGETIGLQRIQKENTELREAVRRRTAELELKNRELEVEAALERVRARTMAMRKSDELMEVAYLLHKQLKDMEFSEWGCTIMLMDEASETMTCWFVDINTSQSTEHYDIVGKTHPIVKRYWSEWKQQQPFFSIYLKDEEKFDFDNFIFEETGFQKLPSKVKEAILQEREVHLTYASMRYGLLEVTDVKAVPEEFKGILPRFAKVFEQTYTRFLDLQKAEAQAREAQIEAALERVRSRATAMRHSDELSEAAELLYSEFLKLGVESFSCGYLINDDEKGEWKIWLTNPGEPFFKEFWTAPYTADHHLKARYESWKHQEAFHCAVLEGEENRAHHIVISQYSPWKADMLDALPPRLVFNSAHFSLGHLLVISPDRLAPELEEAMVRFAKVFDLAYRRFLDLQKAEEQALAIRLEKERLERVLAELQATQSQLIQQEKLASLGQLTAGIAHEIKNPLNFVNNFSEVSKELLEELREEIKKGDWAEVEAIAADLEQNLGKIHQHGARADGIVQSMLQHARGGDGQLEPTDLNDLVKEYVNLAYHGMRAGAAPINVTIDADLDAQIGKIPLVAEDFSRVILNLCQNAFDAMRQKLDKENGYQPKLSIRTRKTEEGISIELTDNGPGIPEAIRDKVLQPFFTTKKGTAGTGLGLSISNDIVKAHGGKTIIRSTPGEATTFLITLPLQPK